MQKIGMILTEKTNTLISPQINARRQSGAGPVYKEGERERQKAGSLRHGQRSWAQHTHLKSVFKLW